MLSVLLDTNVVSALISTTPNPVVHAWIARQSLDQLFFSSVGEAELRYGAAILPVGRKKRDTEAEIEYFLRRAFNQRILPFDREAALAYSSIAAHRRFKGRPINPLDCEMAAIAISRQLAVATRDISDFEDIGLELVNPWTDA